MEEKWRIYFEIAEHFLLNSGFPAVFQGKKVAINLNRPFYVSQIIQYCRNSQQTRCKQRDINKEKNFQTNQCGYKYFDGIEILRQTGYEISKMYTHER